MVKAWEPREHQWVDTVDADGTEVIVSTVLLATIDYSTGKLKISIDPEHGQWETALFWGDDESEVVERYTGQRRAELGHHAWTNFSATTIALTIKENT